MLPHAGQSQPVRQGALAFILATLALDAVGIGLLIPVMPSLITKVSGADLSQAAVYGGSLTALYASVQFIAAPILGSLSDHYGRRPVLLLSLTAFGLSYVLMGFADSLAWLFFAQCLTGLFGATQSAASACVADLTAPAVRAKYFGFMGAAFGSGLVLGPVLGGLLVESSARAPFFAAALLSFINVAIGLIALPESLRAEARRPFQLRSAHPIGTFLYLRSYSSIPRLVTSMLLLQVAMQTLPATWPYFAMEKFGWRARDVGLSLGVYGVANIVIQAGITGWLVARIGDSRTAKTGFSLLALGYLGFAFAPHSALLLASIPITVMGFMAGPALTSLMSARIDAHAQGALQGLIASTISAAAIITPPIATRIFSLFTQDSAWRFPGAPYVLGAGCAMAGVYLVRRKALHAS